jgi:hypothetical protein
MDLEQAVLEIIQNHKITLKRYLKIITNVAC